ncbi:MAG: Ig-like domain-containing protein, partial [bacterium]|nr:Ig-like domain-containing protein [bacterium]
MCRREITILAVACALLFAAGSIVGLTAVKAGDTPISLYISAPESGATVAGDATMVSVVYNCQLQPVVSLELYVDDRFYDIYQPSKPGMQGQHDFRWNTLSCSQGTHKLRINAYDAGGNVAVAEIKVNVSAGPAVTTPASGTESSSPEGNDNEGVKPGDGSTVTPATPVEAKPSVKIVKPDADSRVDGTTDVIVSVNNMEDFKYMIFYVDSKLKKISNVAPFRYEWSSDKEKPGQHKLSVRAYSEAGSVVIDDCQVWVRVDPPVVKPDIKPEAGSQASAVAMPEATVPQVTGTVAAAVKPETADVAKASAETGRQTIKAVGDAYTSSGITATQSSNPLLPGLKSPTIGAVAPAGVQTPVVQSGSKNAVAESYTAKIDAGSLAREIGYAPVSAGASTALSGPSINVPQVTASAPAKAASAAAASATKDRVGVDYVVKAGAESVARELGVDSQEMAVVSMQPAAPVVPQVTASAPAKAASAAAASATKDRVGVDYVVKAGAESVARELGVAGREMAAVSVAPVVPVVPRIVSPSAGGTSVTGVSSTESVRMVGTAPEISVFVPVKPSLPVAVSVGRPTDINLSSPSVNVPQVEPLNPSAVIASAETAGSKGQAA